MIEVGTHDCRMAANEVTEVLGYICHSCCVRCTEIILVALIMDTIGLVKEYLAFLDGRWTIWLGEPCMKF